MDFQLISDFKPKGSQPEAIKQLVSAIKKNLNSQVLLGVTGSGKTFTIANVIEQVKKPTIVIAHNKTLAAQLYNEFLEFFPKNRVEYFVSFYDYYQPEAYIPQKDQYIEKDAQINEKIEQMRLSATASIISRKDVIVVASVSCIYNVGNPQFYRDLGFDLKVSQRINRKDIQKKLVDIQYQRNDIDLSAGNFRIRGETIDIALSYSKSLIRIEMFGDEIDRIIELERVSLKKINDLDSCFIFPAKHFVTPQEEINNAIIKIKKELKNRLPELDLVKAHRLKQRTLYDIEMLLETGYCKGIENYSRFFDKREKGEKPFCLLDYFGDNFLIVIDESHQMIPQARGMHKGDFARKKNLVDYGFRLESAFDNRPLNFYEFEQYLLKNQVIYVSATPGDYEMKRKDQIVEQIIRPTGLLDPEVFVRPSKNQIEDLNQEIQNTLKRNDRVLVTTLTKKLAEELTEYFEKQEIKSKYLHSEIDTLERNEIIRELRLGIFDVLVGINLLREGIDIPEIGFIAILDADKEGFLRNARSLIQIIGRAARNNNSKVVLYSDKETNSIKNALNETKRRREIQIAYNKKHNITPQTIIKPVKEKEVSIKETKKLPASMLANLIIELNSEMKKAAENLNFEKAIELRDKIRQLEQDAKLTS